METARKFDSQDERTTLHQHLERYLDCPTADSCEQLRALLAAYQTRWIESRAGSAAPAAPPAEEKAEPAPDLPLPRVAFAELEVLQKLAAGWVATTADVPRWSWFENRELVTLAPHPEDPDLELLQLSPLGRAVVEKSKR